jgi:hypothetical protein
VDPDYHNPSKSKQLDAALKYAKRRIPVLPVSGKKPPLTPNGFYDATTDRSRITAWWNRHPGANIGIPTGGVSGLVVVDRDGNSPEAKRIWDSLPPTLEVSTSRGRHRYYTVPVGTKIKSRKLASDVDLKADRGYVVAPPSIHPDTGVRYEVVPETRDIGIADLPDELLVEPEPRHPGSRQREATTVGVDDGEPIPDGERNLTLTSIGGRKRAQGLGHQELEDYLLAVNAERCTPPLEEDEVRRIAASVARYEAGDASAGPSPRVRAALSLLRAAAAERPKRGMRGSTGWSCYMAALDAARQHGVDHRDGVELSLDVRTWAQMAGTSAASVSRFIGRSPLLRQLRRGSGKRSGSVVLLVPREIGVKLQHSTTGGGSIEPSVADGPLYRTLYRLRWGPGRIGKSKAALLAALVECPGASRSELARRLGRKPESLKKPLKWLVDAGLLVRTGWGRYDLAEDFSGRLDDQRELGREPEADRLQMARHNRERDGYRNRHERRPTRHVANLRADRVADGVVSELEPVREPDRALLDALGEFLRRNSHRTNEPPSWLSVALWAEEYLPSKPPPEAVEVALADLRREAA